MSSHNIALDQDVVVTQLKGKIYLVAADGSQKPLAEGDVLPKDAVLITPEGASFNGGNQTFTLSPTNEQQAEDETSQAPLLAQNQDVPAGNPDDIAALQQAILGGTDPTKAFEAAAAGGAPAAGGGNIGYYVAQTIEQMQPRMRLKIIKPSMQNIWCRKMRD